MDPQHNLTGKSIIDELSFGADSTLHPHVENMANILNQVTPKPEENESGADGPVSNVTCNPTSTGPTTSAAEVLFPNDTSSSSSEDILPQKPVTDTPALTQEPSSSAVTQTQSIDSSASSSIPSGSKPVLPDIENKESGHQSDSKSENKVTPDVETDGGPASFKGKEEAIVVPTPPPSKVEPKEDDEKESNDQPKAGEKRKIDDDGMDEQSTAKQKSEKHEERLKMQ